MSLLLSSSLRRLLSVLFSATIKNENLERSTFLCVRSPMVISNMQAIDDIKVTHLILSIKL